MKKNLFRILSLILALVVLGTSLSFATVTNSNFYENAAQQNMDAFENAQTSVEKVFYLTTAMYNYCYTKGVGRAAKILEKVEPIVDGDPENLAANSQFVAIMAKGAGDILFDKLKYKDAKTMYEAAVSYSQNYDAKADDVAYCEDQLAKCEKGAKVDMILIVAAIVLVAVVIIVLKKNAKKKQYPNFSKKK